MAKVFAAYEPTRSVAREVSQALVLLALSGGCFGGLVGMLAIAARALGR
jgi:hypothetical protein